MARRRRTRPPVTRVDASNATGVIVALAGWHQSHDDFRRMTDLDAVGHACDRTVVYASALAQNWMHRRNRPDSFDVVYLWDLLSDLANEFSFRNNVLVGFSDGASMIHCLAATESTFRLWNCVSGAVIYAGQNAGNGPPKPPRSYVPPWILGVTNADDKLVKPRKVESLIDSYIASGFAEAVYLKLPGGRGHHWDAAQFNPILIGRILQ